MKTIRVAAAVIRDGEKIFAVQRGYGEFKGGWEFPGGKIEEGESKEEAIVREIWEELDCHIEVKEKIGESTKYYGEGILTLTVFRCEMKNPITIKEHDAYVWIKPENLFSLVWAPVDLPILKEIQRRTKKDS